jgi:hypothetical protein
MKLDSDEILVYSVLGAMFLVWAALSLSAWLSLHWTRRSPPARPVASIVLGVTSTLLAVFCLMVGVEFTAQDNKFTVDLRWLFLLPFALGLAALIVWFRVWKKMQYVA